MLTFVLECACVGVVLFYFQRSLLWKRASRSARCGVALLTCALVVLAGLLDDDMHELVEHGVFKNRDLFVHQYIQSAPRRTHVHHEHEPHGLYVFQHVPRTAGDSMEIMLFAEYGRIVQYALPFRYNWANWGTSEAERRDRLASRYSNDTKVISGFWGREDIAWMQRHMPNRTMTRFTFLRDPRERALSMVSFANIAECEIDPIGVPCSFRWALERVFNASRRDARGHVHFPDDAYLETYLVNSQTWMLGDTLFADARNRSLSDDELLARAKRALDEMAFVGFYDDLAADFLGLWRTVFRHVDIPLFFPWLFCSAPMSRVRASRCASLRSARTRLTHASCRSSSAPSRSTSSSTTMRWRASSVATCRCMTATLSGRLPICSRRSCCCARRVAAAWHWCVHGGGEGRRMGCNEEIVTLFVGSLSPMFD